MVRITQPTASFSYARAAYGLILIAGLLNLWMTLMLPVDRTIQQQSELALHIVAAGTALIQLGIWFIAANSAVRFMRYVAGIKTAPDGRGMSDVSGALCWLIVYIIVLPLTSSMSELSAHGSHVYAFVVLHNYLPLIPMAIAVGYLYRGSGRLVSLVRPHALQKGWQTIFFVVFSLLAILFTWNFYELAPSLLQDSATPRFVLPLPILFFSYVLPHLAIWFFGLLSIIKLWQYSTRVEGSIYRQLFSNFYKGILLVFLCTFIAQMLLASSVTLSNFNIGIALVYAVLVLGVVGYMLIYRGVQELLRLESIS
jgi:hypothetical protein